MNAAYYNENDPFAAAWLRELMRAGLIADGDVDDRSIEDVQPDDVRGYVQCHFFAGIGGWSYALRLAGWSDDRPVWTGSCPCQPFSAAGRRKGTADKRHLWPQFFRLIRECRPAIVFGEQVASKDGLAWLDAVCTDMEGSGYAAGAADLCAAGVGAPHIRQRLYWCAIRVAHPDNAGLEGRQRSQCANELPFGPRSLENFWGGAGWIACRDNKWRQAQPGIFPLVDGIPNRVVKLCGYGNAIVPQVAQAFIETVMEVTG